MKKHIEIDQEKLPKYAAKPFSVEDLKKQYRDATVGRVFFKYIFAFMTLGIGALFFLATTRIVKDGEVSLRRNANGKLILLPPGRYSNFPWEEYIDSPKSLAEKQISLGPYKIITVDTGFVAQTSNGGRLEILKEGQHIITDPSHTFQQFISTKQTVKELKDVVATTRDGVSLTLMADVRYVINNPELALSKMTDITHDIGELAKSNLTNIVLNHSWEDFGHATSTSTLHRTSTNTTDARVKKTEENTVSVVNVAEELTRLLRESLLELGIQLMNISVTGMQVNDKTLAAELAQGAVIKAQTESKRLAAENASTLQGIETAAKVNTIHQLAEAEAYATKFAGQALKDVSETLTTPVAIELYKNEQQIRLVSGAKNTNLFFAAKDAPGALPTLTTNVPTLGT